MCYLLDEHVNPRFRKAIRQRTVEILVWRIGDPRVPKIGTGDPELLLWCEEHDAILVTNNRATMPLHLSNHLAAGRHIPGLFVLRPKRTFSEIVDELVLIALASHPDEYIDRVTYIPLTE